MTQAGRRRFPYAPGALGWVGAGLLLAGLLLELAAVWLLMWLAISRNVGLVPLVIAAFVISFALLGATVLVWRSAWKRAGNLRQGSLTDKQRREFIGAIILMAAGDVLGFGAFVYLAFQIQGSFERRFVLATAPLVLSLIVSRIALNRMRKIQGRPHRPFLGVPPRMETPVFIASVMIASALLLLSGLFWIPK